MIFKKMFSVYSPMWQLLFALTSISALVAIYQNFVLQTPETSLVSYTDSTITYEGHIQFNPAFFIPAVLLLVLLPAYVIVCQRHNRKKGAHKVNPFSLRPNEVIGDDERMQNASANAALKLYIRNHFILPAFAILIITFNGSAQIVAILFMLFITAYYLTYLQAMWPYLGED